MYVVCVCEVWEAYRCRRVLKDPGPARCRWTGKARRQGVIGATELSVNLLITYRVHNNNIQNASIRGVYDTQRGCKIWLKISLI